MVIAYDLRYAADHFTGTSTHAHYLLQALLDLPGPERYVVLWNPALRLTRFDFGPLRSHPRVTWIERPFGPRNLEGLFRVGAWLREVDPDVYFSPFYFLPVAAPCPCVLTVHDVWPLRFAYGLEPWKRVLYRWLLRRATRARFLLTSSDFSRREIGALAGARPEQLRLVRLGVPPLPALAARRPAALPEGPFALAVGLNYPYKNLEALARAWAVLGEGAPLRLVGVGREIPRFPGLADLAARHRAPCVTVLGRVAQEELEWLYRNATLLVFPTRYEGFGFPLVEAFVRGLPALASDIPPLRELGEGAARFVDPGSPEAWADAVRALAADPEARARMRERGLARAAELDYRNTAAEAVAVLREAAGRAA